VSSAQGLDASSWRTLSAARRSNVLRAWLKRAAGGEAAPATLVLRLLDELLAQRAARWPHPAGELRLYRGILTFEARAAVPLAATVARETTLQVPRAGTYRLPGWGGSLRVARVREGGVPLAWLGELELKARAGAEQFQAGIGRPPRSLKKQFQNAGIAAWDRDGPLVYSGGQLVFVPGLGLDARVIGLPGQSLVTLHWEAGQGPAAI